MDVVVERCAGLDVHRDSVVATVRLPGTGKSQRRREQQTRSFGTTIAQLETLADWLAGFGVTLVGMEATGVYWGSARISVYLTGSSDGVGTIAA
jgi:transposase